MIARAKRRLLLWAGEKLIRAGGRCYELATAEERHARAEAERIAADGEAALSEHLPCYARLSWAEGEMALAAHRTPARAAGCYEALPSASRGGRRSGAAR